MKINFFNKKSDFLHKKSQLNTPLDYVYVLEKYLISSERMLILRMF